MAFGPPKILLIRPAAVLVANSPYTLSNSAADSVPTATIAGVNNEPHIVIGGAETFYNATPGKNPAAPFAVGDIYAVELTGYPCAVVRTSAAITEGIQVTTKAGGQVGPAAATDRKILGVTIGTQNTVNGLVEVIWQVVANPLFVPT